MKKKFILLVCASIAIASLYAQDIIITNDAKKIEAKILEVSKSEIRYKEMDNLNGPTFILETDEISSIIYSNGKAVSYNQQATAKEAVKEEEMTQIKSQPNEQKEQHTPKYSVEESTAEILFRSGDTITAQITELKNDYVAYVLNSKAYTSPASQVEKVTFVHNGQVKKYQYVQPKPSIKSEEVELKSTNATIVKVEDNYYIGEKIMTISQYQNFIQSNCKKAWESYQSGCKLRKAGWGLFGVGIGCLIIGVPMTIYGSTHSVKQNTSGTYYVVPDISGIGTCIAGAVFTSIGASFTIASIPCIAVGTKKRNNAYIIYNEQCASPKDAITLNVQASQNGVGLGLVF